MEHPVVLFDGVCNLCNGVVNFLIDRDPDARLRFAALQSDAAQAILEQSGQPNELDTLVFIDKGRASVRSTAVLRIVRHLPWYWQPLRVFWLVPRPLRDALYRLVARNRYRLFGKRDACRMPTPELKRRFMDD